jgi:sodium transport system permease protein
MNWRTIGVVYRKELLDTLRDRRTLIATIVVPLLMLPFITIAFGTAAATSVRKVQKEQLAISILGAEHAPELMELLAKTPALRVEPATRNVEELISTKQLRAALVVPTSFERQVKAGDRPSPLQIYFYQGEMRSQLAVRTLQEVLRQWRELQVRDRLAAAKLSPEVLIPFDVVEENVAPPEKVGGNLLGGLVPYMIIFLSFVGAMGPAMDMTAGEKERGTIETILASAAGRLELVLGKFCMVLTASLLTTVISLFSLALTFTLPFLLLGSGGTIGNPGLQVSPGNVVAVFILIFPVAVTFSAMLLAVALLARSFKEAQSYLSPLMMLVLLPSMASLLPGIEANVLMSMVPVLNVSLISKEVLSGHYQWQLISLVFVSTCIYAGAALALAVYMFKRESVLFRT